jgi:KipI family sensor histidine kinase inhibitor
VRVMRVGTRALLVEVGSDSEVEALHAEVSRRRATGAMPSVGEVVPAARTVLLDDLDDPGALARDIAGWHIPVRAADDGALVEVPTRYDGADLADVAAQWKVPAAEVVEVHSSVKFRVAFCGFAPGFGYLTGLPERYDMPRLATPRSAVPAGSVGLAGKYTGVYPRSSPGGWRLIGRTDLVLWDPAREPATLFTPGTRVRFVPVDR